MFFDAGRKSIEGLKSGPIPNINGKKGIDMVPLMDPAVIVPGTMDIRGWYLYRRHGVSLSSPYATLAADAWKHQRLV